jgi:hypothetical protein
MTDFVDDYFAERARKRHAASALRHPVEEREGRLYFQGFDLDVRADNLRLKGGFGEGVYIRTLALELPAIMRLHRCERCNAPFIGHRSAYLCSEACVAASRRQAKRESAKRLRDPLAHSTRPWSVQAKRAKERREAREAAIEALVCRHCGGPIDNVQRVGTRVFCSNKCRQAHYRQRRENAPQ